MGELNIKKISDRLSGIAKKKQLDHKDIDLLRTVKDNIAEVLQTLKVCDVCGNAVTEIARIEINGVKAAVCHDCGIKALKSKSLKVRATRRVAPTSTPAPKAPHAAAPEEPAVRATHRVAPTEKNTHRIAPDDSAVRATRRVAPTPRPSAQTAFPFESKPAVTATADPADHFQEIADQFGLKMGTVKRLHQIAGAIAMPMDIERTTSYVKLEAQRENIPVDKLDLKGLLQTLVKKAGLKVKS